MTSPLNLGRLATPVKQEYRSINCPHCNDNGWIELGGADKTLRDGISVELAVASLNAGRICICQCDRGQKFVHWLDEMCAPMLDRHGKPLPSIPYAYRGVPDILKRTFAEPAPVLTYNRAADW